MTKSVENWRNVTLALSGGPYPPDVLAGISNIINATEGLYAVNPALAPNVTAVSIPITSAKTPSLKHNFTYTFVGSTATYTFVYVSTT